MTTYGKIAQVTESGTTYRAKEIVALVVATFPETNKSSILPSDTVEGSKYLGKKNSALFTKTGNTYTRV